MVFEKLVMNPMGSESVKNITLNKHKIGKTIWKNHQLKQTQAFKNQPNTSGPWVFSTENFTFFREPSLHGSKNQSLQQRIGPGAGEDS